MPFRRFDCAADQDCMTNNRKQPYLCGDSKGLSRKIGLWVDEMRMEDYKGSSRNGNNPNILSINKYEHVLSTVQEQRGFKRSFG